MVGRLRCMTARDRLRAWKVNFFGSSNLTHKSCGIFVASLGFAHCRYMPIGIRLVFHNFLSQRKEDKWSNAKKNIKCLKCAYYYLLWQPSLEGAWSPSVY